MKHDTARDDASAYVYGKHVLMEALRHMPHVVEEVYIKKDTDDRDLLVLLKDRQANVAFLESAKLPKDVREASATQGVVARINLDALVQPYTEFIDQLEVTERTALLVLGEVQDPQNVGAVIRAAAAFGLAGVLIPPHNQAQVTGSVIKVSAGMAFRVPLVSIVNVNTIARDLKDRGFWIYGLDGEATQELQKETFSKPSVFILGNEADGLRLKTKEVCDILLRIPIHPRCESLNAAAATSVALFAWSSQHNDALRA